MAIKIGIYKITSPDNRIYIGQSRNIEKRFNYYKKMNCKRQVRLYNSFIKYKYENHIFEIIEECEFEQLNIRERYWQEYYNVISENGLNCRLTETNELPRVISSSTRLKMSNSKKNNLPSHIGRKGSENSNSKRVICTETGKIWESIADCSREIGMKMKSLSNCLNGNRKNKTTIKFLSNGQ